MTGYTRIVAKQNDVTLAFVLDDEDCRHLAALLVGEGGARG